MTVRGHWRETWATISLTVWWTLALYELVQTLGWFALHAHTSPWSFFPVNG